VRHGSRKKWLLLNICAMIFRPLNIPFIAIAIGEAFGLPSEKHRLICNLKRGWNTESNQLSGHSQNLYGIQIGFP